MKSMQCNRLRWQGGLKVLFPVVRKDPDRFAAVRRAAVAAQRRFSRFPCTRKLRHIEQQGRRMHDTVAA
jgi:hypothetical protein